MIAFSFLATFLLNEVLLQLVLDEIVVAEDFLEVFFGTVVELNNKSGAIVRKSWKPIPSSRFFPLWDSIRKSSLIFSVYVALNIFAKSKRKYQHLTRSSLH